MGGRVVLKVIGVLLGEDRQRSEPDQPPDPGARVGGGELKSE